MINRLKLLPFLVFFFACQLEKEPSNDPPELVNTESRPTNTQWKGTWAFQDSTLFFSNEFEGARLNGLIMDSTDHFIALITAENYPINPSPWYAFKLWSTEPREITVALTYTYSRNRYYPKISKDGENFVPVDSSRVTGYDSVGLGIDNVPETIEIKVSLETDTTWISAQELWTSSDVKRWVDRLSENQDINQSVIGKSVEGRPIRMLEIGDTTAEKGILIISRQHPPELTGFLAMKSFIETLAGPTEQASQFRQAFKIYNVPLVNPDGVDNGHWRHNMGGIDLNRDWQEFHQPETSAVRDFLLEKIAEGVQFAFAADFHSTWKDVYYPLDSTVVDASSFFIYDWIEKIEGRLEVDTPNVQPSPHIKPTMVSRNYFYHNHGIPSIVFEMGDNTDREYVDQKGRIAAEELMEILLRK